MSNLHGTSPEHLHSLGSARAHGWAEDPGSEILLGESVAIRRLRTQVQRVAPYFRTALIRGEQGTGKHFVARALHSLSSGASGPFVAVSALAVAEAMILAPQSAQTAAIQWIEPAQGGTLYLEGAGELALELQPGMLRFLNARDERATTLHGEHSGKLDLRLLASTTRDLRMLTSIGQFDHELYTRLSAVELVVPPLRQRAEDIASLAAWLLHRFSECTGFGLKMLTHEATVELERRAWSDNLAELEQVLGQAAMLASGPAIESQHLPPAGAPLHSGSSSQAGAQPASERLQDMIDRHVIEVLTRCGGNKLRAAARLGISRSTLYRMLETTSASGSARK